MNVVIEERFSLRFAVSTPRGVVFNENILLVIKNNILVGTGDDDRNWALLGLGNRLRLDARLNLAFNNLLDELANILSLQLLLLVIRVLGVLHGVLNGERRELLRVEVKVASVGAEHLGVNSGNVDGSPVLLCDRLEFLDKLLALLLGFGKYVCQRNTGLQIQVRRLTLSNTEELIRTVM